MNNIENIYLSYESIIQEFSQEKIQSRYTTLYQEMENFIRTYSLDAKLSIDEMALTHAVLDYFTDVSRLKKLHHITNINEIKVCAYENAWILRRHPIQILDNSVYEEQVVFANEKFVFSRIAQFLLGNCLDKEITQENRKSILNYFDSLYYHLKYRSYNAQMLELAILSFQAGALVGKDCGI